MASSHDGASAQQSLLDNSTLASSVWSGIPGALRDQAWPILIGNDLRVNPSLFLAHADRGRLIRLAALQQRQSQRFQPNVQASAMNGTEILGDPAKASKPPVASSKGSPGATAGAITEAGQPGSDDLSEEPIQHSAELLRQLPLVGQDESSRHIAVDVYRTFPELRAFFCQGGPLERPLLAVLDAMVSFRPDIGYIQGMSFLAAFLLLQVHDPCTAFQCMANLVVTRPWLADFIHMREPAMRARVKAMWQQLQEQDGALVSHLDGLGFEPQVVVFTWVLTLFTQGPSIDVAVRLWDCLMFHGEEAVWRGCMGLFLALREQLLAAGGFGEVMQVLAKRSLPIEDLRGGGAAVAEVGAEAQAMGAASAEVKGINVHVDVDLDGKGTGGDQTDASMDAATDHGKKSTSALQGANPAAAAETGNSDEAEAAERASSGSTAAAGPASSSVEAPPGEAAGAPEAASKRAQPAPFLTSSMSPLAALKAEQVLAAARGARFDLPRFQQQSEDRLAAMLVVQRQQ